MSLGLGIVLTVVGVGIICLMSALILKAFWEGL